MYYTEWQVTRGSGGFEQESDTVKAVLRNAAQQQNLTWARLKGLLREFPGDQWLGLGTVTAKGCVCRGSELLKWSIVIVVKVWFVVYQQHLGLLRNAPSQALLWS